jgi:hypothetical protein
VVVERGKIEIKVGVVRKYKISSPKSNKFKNIKNQFFRLYNKHYYYFLILFPFLNPLQNQTNLKILKKNHFFLLYNKHCYYFLILFPFLNLINYTDINKKKTGQGRAEHLLPGGQRDPVSGGRLHVHHQQAQEVKQ